MKKYCIVGTGGRGIIMFGLNIVKHYSDIAQITGLCDINPGRLDVARQKVGADIPTFTDFEQMLNDVECDTVIVATRDDTHHEYIIRALQRGKDVITEKPMTTDEVKCRAILEAERMSGKHIYVTFNYRFVPIARKIKEVLDSGAIGQVHSIDLQWFLDTIHGASYNRRWNSQKEYSGGLLVHKSTHHFDLINWWLNQAPEQVFAYGSQNYYGKQGPFRGERCSNCLHQSNCAYYLDIEKDSWMKEMYVEHEKEDGYIRDRCLFDPIVNIEDTMSVLVKYSGGTQLNYSLVSYAPFEGWRVGFNGSQGRMEVFMGDNYVIQETKEFEKRKTEAYRKPIDWRNIQEGDHPPEITKDEIRIYPIFGGVKSIFVDRMGLGENDGGHWGADTKLLDMLFMPDQQDARMMAGSKDGALSILVGIAANKSIAENIPVNISSLLKNTK